MLENTGWPREPHGHRRSVTRHIHPSRRAAAGTRRSERRDAGALNHHRHRIGSGTVVMNDFRSDKWAQPTDHETEDDWPDLDQLLDLDPPGHQRRRGGEDVDRPVNSLQTAISSMRRAASKSSTDETGLATQRAQMNAIRQIDALIEANSSPTSSRPQCSNGQSNPERNGRYTNQQRAPRPTTVRVMSQYAPTG